MKKRKIKKYNEKNVCDDDFKEEIDKRIGCYDESGEFLRYRATVKGVEIYIVYSFEKEQYMAFFRKMDKTFEPQESSFRTKTWYLMEQFVAVEMRHTNFMQFIGILAQKKILKAIQTRAREVFANTP